MGRSTVSTKINAKYNGYATGGGGGGGVTQIIAGTNITISPAGGTGAVTINATGGGGTFACTDLNPCYADVMMLDAGVSFTYTLNNPVERTKLFGSNTGVNARFNSYLNMY